MATKTKVMAARSGTIIPKCEDIRVTPSRQASRMTHSDGKADKRSLNITHLGVARNLLPGFTRTPLEAIMEEETPMDGEEKQVIEEAEVVHTPVTTNAETTIAKGDASAMITEQSKALERLAILDALEREVNLRVRREKPEYNAAIDNLISHSATCPTGATDQDVQNGPDKADVLNGCRDILNGLKQEQEHVNDHFPDPLEQHHSDTDDEGSDSRVADYIAIGPYKDIDNEEITDASSTDKEAKGGDRILPQGNNVADMDKKKFEKEDDLSNDAVNHKDSENVAYDDPAVLEVILDIPKLENVCVPTVYTPQGSIPIASTQPSSQVENADAAPTPAGEAEVNESATTPDEYAVREHALGLQAEEEINSIRGSPCSMPEHSKVENNGSGAVAATSGPLEAALPPKPDLATPVAPYEIKPVAKKGTGMFATRFLPRGTRILQEPPLLLLDHNDGEEIYHVPLIFQQLPPHAQSTYLNLAATPNRLRDPTRLEWLNVLSRTPMHAPLTFPIPQRHLVLQIFETNSFAAGARSAIVPTASRINHSCTPNVYHNWNPALGPRGELTVHAIRDIAAGEELTTSYVNICTYHAQRQEQLDHYGFQCDCTVCDMRTATAKDSEERRARLFLVEQWVDDRCSRLDGTEAEAAQLEAGTLEAVVETIALLRAEGLYNMELTRHYRLACTICALLGDFVEACVWVRKALELTQTCTGTDYAGYAEDMEGLRMLEERVHADEMMGGGYQRD